MAVNANSGSAALGSEETVATIDATLARRKASAYVFTTIGDRLMGIEPTFVPGERPVWRVPIVLTSYENGAIGEVGVIEIDALTAEPIVSEPQVRTIKRKAIDLARRTTTHPR